jgi:penicillin G amidase
MLLTDHTSIRNGAQEIELSRGPQGVACIKGIDLEDAHFGLGFCHARDRGLQMVLQRILARGEACEKLQDSQEAHDADRFFRRWNFSKDAAAEEAALSAAARAYASAYCRGANAYFERKGMPWELRLLGCCFESWTVRDMFLISKLAALVGLAQTQGEMEHFLVEAVQRGVSRERLEELFPGQLGGLREELIRRVKLTERLVPESIWWTSGLPRFFASNNWALAGSRTASGKPMFCNDPHLEINRLPPIWYEVMLRWQSPDGPRYAMGGTLPGVSGVVFGRTPQLAWGVTYAFMDCIDSWIEECKEGKFRRGDAWIPFAQRSEILRRKRQAPVELTFYENEHGVLDGNPSVPGFYLATRWAGGEGTSAEALHAVCGMLTANTVEEGRDLLGRLSNASWNWVLADRSGSIGYQMSGKMPRRRPGVSGLVPLPGWDPGNDWQGFEAPENLPRALNPPEGFLVTANEDLNHLGRVRPLNLPMASDRAQRIRGVLARMKGATVQHMQELQYDVYSLKAEQFMALLRPLLQELSVKTESVRILLNWDLKFTCDSRAAVVFERFYHALIHEVFGGLGEQVVKRLLTETCVFYEFYGNFDRVLLAEKSAWFGGRAREEIYRAALARAVATRPQVYGAERKLRMRHLLFGGKLPVAFGFDRIIELRGCRSTVHQGQIFRSGGRDTSLGPSLHLVTDLSTDSMHTTLPGGPSDRRFSKWYVSGLRDWLNSRYKALDGFPAGEQFAAKR